ncbi:hypothetical protein [Kangiella sp. TOML190]|uniref:hypothetical protein n=1 Tax=Kangiella sp. TOML190 TaxID=2931351 RepID=UPI00203E17A4|nr:hypothetical protein [Kangiella sp. TOML190]
MKKFFASVVLFLVCASVVAQTEESSHQESSYQEKLDYIYSIRLNDINEAKRQLAELAQELNNLSKPQRTQFYNLRAHSELIRGNIQESLGYSRKAESLANKYDFVARAKSLQVVALASSGNYQKSFIELYEILDRIDEIESAELKQSILQNALSQHTNAGIFDKSQELIRMILAQAKRNNSDYYNCFGFLELALLNLTLGNHKQVQFDIDSATTECRKAQNNMAYLTLDVYRAKLSNETGKTAEAKRIYEQQYPKLKTFGWKSMLVDAQIAMAEIYLELKELEKIEPLALAAYNYAKEVNNIREVRDSSLVLSQYFTEIKDDDKAGFYKNKYLEAANELNTQLQKKRIAYYQAMNYRAVKKQSEKEEDLVNLESEKKNNLPVRGEFKSPHP